MPVVEKRNRTRVNETTSEQVYTNSGRKSTQRVATYAEMDEDDLSLELSDDYNSSGGEEGREGEEEEDLEMDDDSDNTRRRSKRQKRSVIQEENLNVRRSTRYLVNDEESMLAL